MTCKLDHFMYAVPSLDEGMQWARDTFGVDPAYGGEHVGMGTCNALLSLGDTYLEIIAPDTNQTLSGNLGEQLADLNSGGLVTFAVQGTLPEIAAGLKAHGINCRGPNRTRRQTTSGETLVWELLIPRRTEFRTRLPFYIDWLECPHPAATNPAAGSFLELTITDLNAEKLMTVFRQIGLDQTVNSGEGALSLTVQTRNGTVQLTSTPETNAISMG